jgi:hypothetical protein
MTADCVDQFNRIIMNRRRPSSSLVDILLQNDQLSPCTNDEEKPPSSPLPRALQVFVTLFRQRSQSNEGLSAKNIQYTKQKVMYSPDQKMWLKSALSAPLVI